MLNVTNKHRHRGVWQIVTFLPRQLTQRNLLVCLAACLMAIGGVGVIPGELATAKAQADAVVIDLSDPSRWHATLMAFEDHTETAVVEKIADGLRFSVLPYLGKASHVWHSEPLLYPVPFKEHYPFLVVRYRAMNLENKSKLAVISLQEDAKGTGRIRFEPLKVHQLTADGEPQVFRVDLRKVSSGGKRTGIAHQFAVSVRGNGQGIARFELLDMRFEKDPAVPDVADEPGRADSPLSVRVIDEQGQPLPEAKVALRSMRADRVKSSMTDAQGLATLGVWQTEQALYRVEVSAAGRVTMMHSQVAPDEQVEVKLEKSHEISGVVRDMHNKPVAGVVIVFGGHEANLPPGLWMLKPAPVLSDEQGQWKQSGFPASWSKVILAPWHATVPPPYDASMDLGEYVTHYTLGSGPAELTLTAGWSITGKVVDDEGKPVEGVKVYRDNQLDIQNRKPSVLTDDKGHYAVRNFKSVDREVTLTFIKENKAPVQLTVQAGEAPTDMQRDVRLAAGKEFHFLVVDQNDKPVKGVRIRAFGFKEYHGDLLDSQTDAQGRLSWVSGPDQAMQFSIVHNRRPVTSVKSEPGQVTRIELRGPIAHTGAVVDASTGDAIKTYEVSIAYELDEYNRQPDGPPYGWWQKPLNVTHGKGQFEYSALPTEKTWYLRIVAEGYAPYVSKAFSADAPSQSFAIQLTPVKTIAGSVLLPDGKPAEKAQVYVVNKGQWLLFTSDGTFGDRQMLEAELFTDEQGRFRLPSEHDRKKISAIVIVHEQGTLEIRDKLIDTMTVKDPMTLEPWAILSGQAMRSGKPDPGATIVALPLYYPQDQGKPPLTGFDKRDVRWEYKVQADDQGKFTLRMTQGGYEVGKQIEYAHRAWRPSQTHHLLLKAGEERKDFQIGGSGRSFKLKLTWKDQPPVWKVGFASIVPARHQDEEAPGYVMINELAHLNIPEHHHHHDYEVTVGFDQMVQGHDIPPGKYRLQVQLWSERFTDTAKLVADVEAMIDIPEVAQDQRQVVVDLGELAADAPADDSAPAWPGRAPARPGHAPAPPR